MTATSPIVKWLSPPTLNRVSQVRTLVGETFVTHQYHTVFTFYIAVSNLLPHGSTCSLVVYVYAPTKLKSPLLIKVAQTDKYFKLSHETND